MLERLNKFLNTLTPIWPLIFVFSLALTYQGFRPSEFGERLLFLIAGAICTRATEVRRTWQPARTGPGTE